MSKFWVGNIFLALSVISASGSQVVLKALFNETGPLGLNVSLFEQLFSNGRIFRLAGAMIMIVAGFVFWMMSLSRLDLSYAYSLACSSALLVALFSVLFLGETVSAKMWLGVALIVLGTVLLVPAR